MTYPEPGAYRPSSEYRRGWGELHPSTGLLAEYAVLPAQLVAPKLRRAVTNAVQAATGRLRLGSVQVRWIVPAALVQGEARLVSAPPNRAGFADPGLYPSEVFVHPFSPSPVATALHETRHLWQWRAGWYAPHDGPLVSANGADCRACRELERMELDAERWATQWLPRLGLAEYRGERRCRLL